jgi:D-alanyl-D-alanine carboxypeptidase
MKSAPPLVRYLTLVSALASTATVTALAKDDGPAAYIVIDHASGHVLEEFNATKKLQIASLTKIVTAAVVLDWAHASKQSVDQLATVPKFHPDLLNPQGIQWTPGDRASLKDLLYAALLQSDNVAAETLASFVGSSLSGGQDRELHNVSFVAQMNALARKLGMINSRFLNAHGLDTLESKRPFSTAEDSQRLRHGQSGFCLLRLPEGKTYRHRKGRRLQIQLSARQH